MKEWILESMKIRGRIYIFPTKMGGYFNGLIFLMFLLSIGYSNNLLLIFTLFLFGLNLLWLVQTHFHLYQLKFERLIVDDGHALEAVPFSVVWKDAPLGPRKWELRLESDKGPVELKILDEAPSRSIGELEFKERGIWRWKYLRVATEKPFGLYRAWRFIQMEGKSYAYPKLSAFGSPLPLERLALEGEVLSGQRGSGEIRGLLPYSPEGGKISWKHYARSGELFIKEGEETKSGIAELKFIPAGPAKEETLSILATQMVGCHREGVPFSFELNGQKLGPALGPKHLKECLRELSTC